MVRFNLITLHTFASGSEGNCLLLSSGSTHILLDAGISCRRIRGYLQELGLTLTDLQGVFITHSHSDHVCGLQTLCKSCEIPVYTGTLTGMALGNSYITPHIRFIAAGDVLWTGDIKVTAFPTSHDAPGSLDFRFDCGGSVGVLTDTGYVTDEAAEVLRGVDVLVLESNYDVARLKSGPYPYMLQQRILGDRGHLSNETAALFAREMASFGTKHFILAHLSRENNTPELALSAMEAALEGFTTKIDFAPRCGVSCAYVAEELLCRK